jgi:hypothetical protein
MYILAYGERITKFDYGLPLKKFALCFKIRKISKKPPQATDIFEGPLRLQEPCCKRSPTVTSDLTVKIENRSQKNLIHVYL